MRYHKAVKVTKSEADFIIATGISTLSDVVVISRGDNFYDVRALSHSEVEDFVEDLARAEQAALAGQTSLPC